MIGFHVDRHIDKLARKSSDRDRVETMSPSTDGTGIEEMERIAQLFPLTFPIPSPLTHKDLIPLDDLVFEQELIRNPDNIRTWMDYISHVEETNYRKRPMPDQGISSDGVNLLGFLCDEALRLALQRTVSLYERALSVFPTSYKLWHRYLNARTRFVLGEPHDGIAGRRQRLLQSINPSLEMGPALLEMRHEEEMHEKWDFALDGTLGWKEWCSLAAAYERALLWLPNMPRIWLDYLTLFIHPACSPILSKTHARRTFDRALRTLTGSLHLRIWKLYLRWAELCSGETARVVWRRYLNVDPSLSEQYSTMLLEMPDEPRYFDGSKNALQSFLKDKGEDEDEDDDTPSPIKKSRVLEAAKLLLCLARKAWQGGYVSPNGKSSYHLILDWLELVERFPETIGLSLKEEKALPNYKPEETVTEYNIHALDSNRLPILKIVKCDGLARFPDQAGRLWTGLASYYIKRGDFDIAWDIFEEGMKKVLTVRDFTQIFDAYAESSENLISFMMEDLEDDEENEDAPPKEDQEAEIDQRMLEFEKLMERRPFLVNDVMLRRNQDDVQEWEKRVALWGENDEEVIATYKKAFETINPRKATANLHRLYIHFAEFYEDGGSQGRKEPGTMERDVTSARQIFERAIKVPYKRVDDLAEVWCSWAEMELRNGNYSEALRVMVRATSTPNNRSKIQSISYYDDSLSPQTRLFKSLKLWAFYTDLEEAIGTLESAKHAFDRILELKIANAQIIINFAQFLEEQHYYEDAFRVYERGVELFTYPVAFELWNVYLNKFVGRYGGSKLERARDMFEQALDKCPANLCKPLYLKYGELEEKYGLVRKAMSIYERAAHSVSDEDRYEMYLYYIAKAAANYGLVASRPIYEAAIEILPDRDAVSMCLRFAVLESKLGEMERARAIYAHASQFCNPKTQPEFWKVWNNFEIENGTEDTFREMLRIKRSVQAQYNTDMANVASSVMASSLSSTNAVPDDGTIMVTSSDPMAMVEAQNASVKAARTNAPSFVAASNLSRSATPAQNNTEKVGGDDDDELL